MEACEACLGFVVAVLGVRAVLDAWFGGGLFAEWRAACQFYRDEGRWWVGRKAGELFSCRLCLSYWAAAAAVLLTAPLLPSWWLAPAWWLGVAGATRVLEDAAPSPYRPVKEVVDHDDVGPDYKEVSSD